MSAKTLLLDLSTLLPHAPAHAVEFVYMSTVPAVGGLPLSRDDFCLAAHLLGKRRDDDAPMTMMRRGLYRYIESLDSVSPPAPRLGDETGRDRQGIAEALRRVAAVYRACAGYLRGSLARAHLVAHLEREAGEIDERAAEVEGANSSALLSDAPSLP